MTQSELSKILSNNDLWFALGLLLLAFYILVNRD